VFALDLGSKNFKLVSGQIIDEQLQVRLETKRTLWLGNAVKTQQGHIDESKLAEIKQALGELAALCTPSPPGGIPAIGTAALRVAENHDRVVAIAADLGIQLEIASGVREGQVAYLAATGGQGDQLVSDLGSQTLQLAWSDGTTIEAVSRPLGYQVIHTRYLGGAARFAQAEQAVRSVFARELATAPRNPRRLIAISSNTAVSWAAGKSKKAVSGQAIPGEVVRGKLDELRAMSPADFNRLQATDHNWQKILPGLILLNHLLDHTGQPSALLAEVELPVGLLVEQLGKSASLHYSARPPEWV
jgi:exopolyphosphatase/pppGpp-phosphohydrolase